MCLLRYNIPNGRFEEFHAPPEKSFAEKYGGKARDWSDFDEF